MPNAQRSVEALPPIQWHWTEVTVALDGLPELVQAVVHVNTFPALSICTCLACRVVIVVEPHADGVEAVERVEDVESGGALLVKLTSQRGA